MAGFSMTSLAATAVLAAAPALAAPLSPADVFAKASPSVWMVQADHASAGNGEAGSAVEVGSRTLVTACHVVDGATSVQVSRGQGKAIYPVAQVTHDPDKSRDLCMLTVSEDLSGAPVALAPPDSVKVGQRVYAIGAPLRLELTLTEGLVSSLRPNGGEALPTIQFSAATAPGSSGGGLFDDQGRLIGLTVAIASKETDNLSFAYPAQWSVELSDRVLAARKAWLDHLAAAGLPLGPNGDAASSGFAELSDTTKLPITGTDTKPVIDAYRQFLLLAKPRAFILTSDNRWGTVSDTATLDAVVKDCAARQVHCRLYAVDDAVVWKP